MMVITLALCGALICAAALIVRQIHRNMRRYAPVRHSKGGRRIGARSTSQGDCQWKPAPSRC